MTRSADARRRAELLDAVVDYVFEHGLSDLSLRPLADAVGTSPRVLLYYYGPSKTDLIQAIISAVRQRQLRGFAAIRESRFGSPREACLSVWKIMTQSTLQPLFRFFFELFGLALQDRAAYAAFLDHAIEDWLAFFSTPLIESGVGRDEARARATIVLAGFRGFLMDLCATGDRERIDRAVAIWLDLIMPGSTAEELPHAQ